MEFINKNKSYILAGFLIALTACGGGGGGDPEPTPTPTPTPAPANIAPTVSVANVSVAEATNVSITATAADVDGTIASYAWVVKSGEQVTLSAIDTNTVNFTTPTLIEDSEVILTVTVTDDDGATASTDVTVTISNTSAIQLTINGKVVNSMAANSTLLLEVAEQSYSATADENGNYSIDINIDDSFADEVVQITATGAGTNSALKLVSLLGDLGFVNTAAGDDGILTGNEIFAVNVTSVTTAIAALMEDSNDGSAITNANAFSKASRSFAAVSTLPFSTAIHLVTDYSAVNADLALPAGMENTWQLVSNYGESIKYIANAKSVTQASYSEAETMIKSNEDIFSAGVDAEVISTVDTYYLLNIDSAASEGRLVLSQDGTGRFYDLDIMSTFSWAKTDSGLIFNYGENGFVESSNLMGGAEVQTIILQTKINWLFQTAIHDLLFIEKTTYRHFPNGEYPDESEVVTSSTPIAVKNSGVISAANILQMDVSYSFPIPSVISDLPDPKGESFIGNKDLNLNALQMLFTGNINDGGNVTVTTPSVSGEGITTYSERILPWSITSNGHLSVTGDTAYDYAFLAGDSSDAAEPAYVNVVSTENAVPRAASGYALKKEAPQWTNDNVVGIYNWSPYSSNYLNYFWIEVSADGTAVTYSATDFDSSGSLTSSEFFIMPGLWQINSAGNLIIRRYRNNTLIDNSSVAYCTPLEYDPADDAECVLYHEREWNLHQIQENGEYFFHHSHRFYDDPFKGWMEDPNVVGHALGTSTISNLNWRKVDSRPVELPETLFKSAQEPLRTSAWSLTALSDLINQEIYQELKN